MFLFSIEPSAQAKIISSLIVLGSGSGLSKYQCRESQANNTRARNSGVYGEKPHSIVLEIA
jgi:hypothetical protein